MSQIPRKDARIPGSLNVTLALGAYVGAAALLCLGSHGGIRAIGAALAFSFLGNTLFSLLHESVHGIFHPSPRVNDAFGCLSAAFFPTGFTFQRICHLGHHRRNRTDAELFDCYRPGENRWLKAYRLYSLLTGFYWLAIPLAALAYLLLGPLATTPRFRRFVAVTGLDPMLADLARARPARLRLELLLSLGVQLLLVFGLGLTLRGWLLCYGAFALNWCALQYTDHAFTIRDIRDGASNLRVNRLVQYVFLNYHHHLAHHQHPQVPWIHLPRLVTPDSERPSFLRTYLRLWAGPRLTLEPAPGPIDCVLDQDLR